MSRSIRVPRAAGRMLAAVGLAVAAAGTGCAAGQITQTARTVPAVDGAHGTVGHIALRAVKIQYPQGGRYREGQEARLTLVMTNQSINDDALTAVRTDAASSTTFTLGSVPSVSASASPSPTGPATTTRIPIPGNHSVIALADGPRINLVGLTRSLYATQVVPVTFSFERAGDITLAVPVAVSLSEVPRPSPIDISSTEQ